MSELDEPEEWRPSGYPGYSVSSHGRVEGPSGYALRSKPNKDGYHSVTIHYHGFKLSRTVHGLVCRAWHGPPPPSMFQVRHLDGNPDHNYPSNLEWGTQSENEYDKVRHGTAGNNKGERHGSARLTNADVYAIRRLYAAGVANQRKIAARFRISQSVVSQIVTRQLWNHLKDDPDGNLEANEVQRLRGVESGSSDGHVGKY